MGLRTFYFIFNNNDLLLQRQCDGTLTVPHGKEAPVRVRPWTHVMKVSPMSNGDRVETFDLGSLRHGVPNEPEPVGPGYEFVGLRDSYYHLSQELYDKAGKCRELLHWDRHTVFCGVCGAKMYMHTDISKRCAVCGNEVWPQLAIAVIVLIHRGEEVLLVHAHHFKTHFFGLVSGFVETGETLEEAVHREVMEETGLTIGNIAYFGSQPWPYPCGLMVGFNADYVSGELRLQRSELSEGGWFRYDNLPCIPRKLSIARRLIDAWLEEYGIVSEQE